MERKLASLQIIEKIEPVEGADRIEKARVLGWISVIEKGLHKEGDLVIFCEVDSVLPDRPEFEFMRARHFRVRTVRFRKQISQGLVFPLSVLPRDKFEELKQAPTEKVIGLNVTEMLNIQKYEPYTPAQLSGKIKGSFPAFLRKTDETRIQSVPKVLERHRQTTSFYVTEKVDGSSFTAFYRGGEFGICSRNLELKEEEGNAYWKLARELDIENKLKSMGKDIAIQGEMVGMGIQKNKYNFPDIKLFIFSMFDISQAKYLDFTEVRTICRNIGLEMVPLVSEVYQLPASIDEIVDYSKGPSLLNKNTPREGLVFRPHTELWDEDTGRLSFKVINPNFLLKYDE